MTTFNNIDDLLRILDENPQLLDAVRARVLTRELLALPETVARLTERVDQIAHGPNRRADGPTYRTR